MPTARLIIQQPGQRSRYAEVAGTVVSVGRRPDNTICLEDSGVSKYHAVIERRGGFYFITDLGSSNGTTVNNEPLAAPRVLSDGDLICLGGNSTLQFHLEGEPNEKAPPGGAGAGLPSPPAVGLPSASGLTTGLTPPSLPGIRAPSAPSMPSAPSVQMPHAPSVNVPSAPSIQVPHAPSVQVPQALQKILGMPRALMAGVSATLAGGVILAALWGLGVVGGSSAKTPRPEDELPGTEQLEELEGTEAKSKDEAAAPPAAHEQGEATTTADAAAPAAAAPPPAVAAAAAAASADATASLARVLAGQISQKSGHTFDPRFVDQIKMYMNDYKATANYYERAGSYRDRIEREFSNTHGIHPLVPYLLAMSQTRFVERGASGVWNLPPSVLRSYPSPADPADSNASTRVAAAYTRELLDTFDREDFMYAVACYGMTVDEAGKVRLALEEKDPGRRLRADFWKMKSAGVVRGAQVERVARFFAAGIVFENPAQFGLKERPLSSLY